MTGRDGDRHSGHGNPEHPEPGHPHHGRPDSGGASPEPGGADEFDAFVEGQLADVEMPALGEHPDTALAAERLGDLQRLQAEYVNYKRRVDRDRDVAKDLGILSVIESLLPVLDDVHAARQHGDLADGPFALIADKLEKTLGKFGWQRYGAPGETFDPTVHEALMHLPDASLPEGATDTTVVEVLMPGYRVGDRIIRAARVAVADPS